VRAFQAIGKVLRTLPMGFSAHFLLFGSFILKEAVKQKARKVSFFTAHVAEK
jgi:hypothetical protein